MPRRLCFALDLHRDADLIDQYEAFHKRGAVWSGVVDLIFAQGFLDMQIWRVDDRCVMIAEVADDFPRPLPQAAEDLDAKWQALMSRFQKPLPNASAGETWREMKPIFDLSEQPRS